MDNNLGYLEYFLAQQGYCFTTDKPPKEGEYALGQNTEGEINYIEVAGFEIRLGMGTKYYIKVDRRFESWDDAGSIWLATQDLADPRCFEHIKALLGRESNKNLPDLGWRQYETAEEVEAAMW
jgi:hypothetical protein